jgi:hypothetical protein
MQGPLRGLVVGGAPFDRGEYDVKVTPLIGTDMPLGPIKTDPPRNFAGWFT